MATMNRSNRSHNQQRAVNGQGNKAFADGIKYNANQYYLAAIYSEASHLTAISGTSSLNGEKVDGTTNQARGIELVTQYPFDRGLRRTLGER